MEYRYQLLLRQFDQQRRVPSATVLGAGGEVTLDHAPTVGEPLSYAGEPWVVDEVDRETTPTTLYLRRA